MRKSAIDPSNTVKSAVLSPVDESGFGFILFRFLQRALGLVQILETTRTAQKSIKKCSGPTLAC